MGRRNLVRGISLQSLLAGAILALGLMVALGPLNAKNPGRILRSTMVEAAGTIIFVDTDATGAGTGTSWADAKTKLQDALEAALSGDQIWVAAGVYYPDEGSAPTDDDPLASFTLKNGVEIYGGFAGTESTLTERDWETNVTVLSGDIDQNDMTDSNGVVVDVADIAGTNAYHVVTGGGTDSSAVLDGFTITAGRANGTGANSAGGGMYNNSSSPMLKNVSFTGNEAIGGGGGMYNSASSSTLASVSFRGNLSGTLGGGIYIFGGNVTPSNVIFAGNSAGAGGGMYIAYGVSTLTNVSFAGNYAINDGGGMYNNLSNLDLGNVTFTGNRAGSGGGIFNEDNIMLLVNTILWNNQALTSGHQIYNLSSTTAIERSDIQGSGGSTSWDPALGSDNGFNIDDDPLFVTPVDPATAPTTTGDLHLQNGSPAIDPGETTWCPSTDLEGNIRPIDGDKDGMADCDMGAYEKLIDQFLPLIVR